MLGTVATLGQALMGQAQAELQLVTECVELFQTLVKALYGSITALSIAQGKKVTGEWISNLWNFSGYPTKYPSGNQV